MAEQIEVPRTQAGGTDPEEVGRILRQQVEAGSRRAARNSQLFTWGLRLALIVVVLVLWEILSGPVLDPFFFSHPLGILEQLGKWLKSGLLFFHLQFTLTEMVLGYVLGVTAGLSVAIVFGLIYYLYRITEPVVLILYSIPSVAIGPLLIIWFGIDLLPKVLLSAFFVFFVVLMNTLTGIRNVNQALVDISLVMGASRRAIITKIILPSAYPYIITALRITLPTALIGAVVGEFISSNRGIAYLIMESSLRYNMGGTFGALFVLALVMILLNSALTPLESRLMRWKPKMLEIVE
jgi:NitT/TauT family transport system permease protein